MLAHILVLLAATGSALAMPAPEPADSAVEQAAAGRALADSATAHAEPQKRASRWALCTSWDTNLCVGIRDDLNAKGLVLRRRGGPIVWHAPNDFDWGAVNGEHMVTWNHEGSEVFRNPFFPHGIYGTWWLRMANNGAVLQLDGTNLCLDVTDGQFRDMQKLQVWGCDWGGANHNQRWTKIYEQ